MKRKNLPSRITDICLAVVLVLLVGCKIASALVEGASLAKILTVIGNISMYAAIPAVIAWVFFHLAKVKEALRKLIVALKRQPAWIPLLSMAVAFLCYSLNLTDISDSTAKANLPGMGLCQFCIMLLSMLCMLCMFNAFPRRKKTNYLMLILAYAMLAVMFYCTIHYRSCIHQSVNSDNGLDWNKYAYLKSAYQMLGTLQILYIITAVLTATLPFYSKLIRKIKTSVEVEDNGQMAAIEIEE